MNGARLLSQDGFVLEGKAPGGIALLIAEGEIIDFDLSLRPIGVQYRPAERKEILSLAHRPHELS
jgi:hypothetical protein